MKLLFLFISVLFHLCGQLKNQGALVDGLLGAVKQTENNESWGYVSKQRVTCIHKQWALRCSKFLGWKHGRLFNRSCGCGVAITSSSSQKLLLTETTRYNVIVLVRRFFQLEFDCVQFCLDDRNLFHGPSAFRWRRWLVTHEVQKVSFVLYTNRHTQYTDRLIEIIQGGPKTGTLFCTP